MVERLLLKNGLLHQSLLLLLLLQPLVLHFSRESDGAPLFGSRENFARVSRENEKENRKKKINECERKTEKTSGRKECIYIRIFIEVGKLIYTAVIFNCMTANIRMTRNGVVCVNCE